MILENSLRLVFDVRAYPYPGRSTRYHALSIRKWLMSRVLPGVPDTLASPCRPVSMLMSDDLPTLLRPMKAMSFSASLGTCEIRSELHLNSALLICMLSEFAAKITFYFGTESAALTRRATPTAGSGPKRRWCNPPCVRRFSPTAAGRGPVCSRCVSKDGPRGT